VRRTSAPQPVVISAIGKGGPKVTLSLCLIRHHGTEVWVHAFLTSAMLGRSTHWVGSSERSEMSAGM
jgi:hypothetical protein